MPRVAFLGLGAIGAPMARHLARPEFDLAVWNRTLPKAEAMAGELGVRHALTPADAARECDVVITCLPVSRNVEASPGKGSKARIARSMSSAGRRQSMVASARPILAA